MQEVFTVSADSGLKARSFENLSVIHQVFYSYNGVLLSHATEERLRPEEYPPDKRLYPETCDLEFCLMLRTLGVNLPFTYFNTDRPVSLWYGKRFEELG